MDATDGSAQCLVWANASAKPNRVRSGTRHFPTAKDSAGEESGICWSSRRSQKTGQLMVVDVLWVGVSQYDRQSAGLCQLAATTDSCWQGLGRLPGSGLILLAESSCLVASWMAPMPVCRKRVYVWFHRVAGVLGCIVLCVCWP